MIIKFKTAEVSGSVSTQGDYYVDAEIDGKINIETFNVDATFSGVMGVQSAGREEAWSGKITGTITDNLDTFNGKIIDNEGTGGEFTATR